MATVSALAPFDLEVPALLEQMVELNNVRRRHAALVGDVSAGGPCRPAFIAVEMLNQLQGEERSARWQTTIILDLREPSKNSLGEDFRVDLLVGVRPAAI